MLNLEKSKAAFEEAKNLMPGGVNSPVRSYANVDCNPPFIAKAKGDRIFDIDGNEYIDYVGSWGPMVVGHAHPNVVKALQEAVTRGTSYGAPTLLESELAKLVMKVYPSIEIIRMVNSGTEATMSALRLARGYTGRDKIVKFIGCYHGHSDSLLVNAGSGMATFGVPSSPGVTKGTAADTISVPYNDVEAITKVMDEMGDEIAAVGDAFTLDGIPLHRMDPLRLRVAANALERLPAFLEAGRDRAVRRAGMLERAGAEVLRDDPGGEGIWPFFMVLMPDRDRRDRALGALWRSGLGVSKLFVRALPDYPYLAGAVEGGPCPAARDLAGRMLTVTNTHWLDDAAFARLAGEICHA